MLMRSLLIMSLSVYNECANHGRKDDMGRVGGGGGGGGCEGVGEYSLYIVSPTQHKFLLWTSSVNWRPLRKPILVNKPGRDYYRTKLHKLRPYTRP